MWTALLGPFSVGVVRWRSPRPSLTVIVKLTLSLGSDGPMQLAPMQLALATDALGASPADDELEYPSDFAPRKARAEVLVVGHAHALMPRTSIPVAIEVGSVSKRFEARAGIPAPTIPLVSSYLRRAESAVRTAPRRADVPQWIGRSLPEGFDYALFNVGPEDQWTDWLGPGQRLALEGLVPAVVRRDAELPALEPVVGYCAQGFDRSPVREVPMVADTLWIQADEALCTLVWRGTLERVPASSSAERLLVATRTEAVTDWGPMRMRLGDAAWARAAQEADLPPGAPARRPLAALLAGAEGAPGGGSSFPPPNAHDDDDEATVAQLSGAILPSPTDEDDEEEPAPTPPRRTSTIRPPAAEAEQPGDSGPPITPRVGLTLGRSGDSPSDGAALGGVVASSLHGLQPAMPYGTQPPTPSPAPVTGPGSFEQAPASEEPYTRRGGTGTLPPAAPERPSDSPRAGTGTVPPGAIDASAQGSSSTRPFGTGTEPPAPAVIARDPVAVPQRLGTGTLPPPPSAEALAPALRFATGAELPAPMPSAEASAAALPNGGSGTLAPPPRAGYPAPPPMPARIGTGTEPPAPFPFPSPAAPPAPTTPIGTGTAPPGPLAAYHDAPGSGIIDAAEPAADAAAATALGSAAQRLDTGTLPPEAMLAAASPTRSATGTDPPSAPADPSRTSNGTDRPWSAAGAAAVVPPAPLAPLIPRAPALPTLGQSRPPLPSAPPVAPKPGETLRPPSPEYQPPAISSAKRAAVWAALREAASPRQVVLAQHGLDERAWRAEERRLALERAATRTDDLGAPRFQADAQSELALAGESADAELDRFVKLKVQIDTADDIERAIADAGLTPHEWRRTVREWRARCRADLRLARRLREELHLERLARRAAAGKDAPAAPR